MTALNVSPIMLTFCLNNICRTEYKFRFFSGYTVSRIVSPINKPMEYDNRTIDTILSIFSRFWFIIFSILSKSFISLTLSSSNSFNSAITFRCSRLRDDYSSLMVFDEYVMKLNCIALPLYGDAKVRS
jgi:hypothetical protein